MNTKAKIILLVLVVAFTTSSSFAKNLGVWGRVFAIEEISFKEFIYARLQQMQGSGELAKLKAGFIKTIKEHISRPTPVAEITTTDQPKIFYYDPTYILTKNILDHKNNIIAKTGTTINPLDTIKLRSTWFFFDADDIRQVKWALVNAKNYNYIKYILVRGNIKDAGQALNTNIYFDQEGIITKQLGIKHVPCIVKEQGKKLQIQEFAVK